ncbi:hypothetical protein EJ06DRAFT_472073 [Trichodelitschia bisporula]|uniref:Large ribosomal subunit protein bL27m n=1 Tax=Trichodelitschia bisporula TaxID=703511 RepID=A0A6G1I4B9_9PEZI|nr:hypothetical protein EJ06DRAFT_472073 [Trichodelitschia bisporula]
MPPSSLRPPLRAIFTALLPRSSPTTLAFRLAALNSPHTPSHILSAQPPVLTSIRHATHAAAGRANGGKNGPGPRLGAKKGHDQYVVPGNIIFRQRGTHWFAGENCALGRDHTVYATQPGYVRYYRDPGLHPERKYIGVALRREQTLPTPAGAVRRRRLGMEAVVREPEVTKIQVEKPLEAGGMVMRPNLQFRLGNWQIGRVADGVRVRGFQKGDRFLAWRRREARKARSAEKRSHKAKGKGKAKAKGKPRKVAA